MASAKRRKIVVEDLDDGIGATTIPTDSGGTRAATKLGLQSFAPGTYNVLSAGAIGSRISSPPRPARAWKRRGGWSVDS